MKQLLIIMLFGFFLLGLGHNDLCAKIYKYVDDNGTMVFVDDESKIPPKYRVKVSKIKEATDDMSASERKAYEKNMKSESAGKTEAQRQQKVMEEHAAMTETRVRIQGNMVIVPVKVRHGRNTATLRMLLDTGAGKTVIYLPALERFSFRRSELGLAQLAGGYVIKTKTVEFYKVEIGPFEQKRMPILIIDSVDPNSPIDGLLGMDFLRKHKYEIDFGRSVIIWKD